MKSLCKNTAKNNNNYYDLLLLQKNEPMKGDHICVRRYRIERASTGLWVLGLDPLEGSRNNTRTLYQGREKIMMYTLVEYTYYKL